MAALAYNNNNKTYQSIGIWSTHYKETSKTKKDSYDIQEYVVTIDKREELTGLNFFCNLPDDIEEATEKTVDRYFWKLKDWEPKKKKYDEKKDKDYFHPFKTGDYTYQEVYEYYKEHEK